jgi:hypothetical protein
MLLRNCERGGTRGFVVTAIVRVSDASVSIDEVDDSDKVDRGRLLAVPRSRLFVVRSDWFEGRFSCEADPSSCCSN